MDGKTLAFITALSKKISIKNSLKYGNLGIVNILSQDNSLIFVLSNGTNIKCQLNNMDFMQLCDFDKNNNGIIDIAEMCNFANKADKAKDSDKLNGLSSDTFFRKDINNTDNIIEGEQNKFITQSDKDKIVKINEIQNQTELNKNNINELEINNKNKKDELVKLNVFDTTGYLEDKIDNNTIQVVDNKLIAKTLNGLTVTIAELNMLQGIKSNIQQQINALSTGMNYKGQFDSFTKLLEIPEPKNGWTAIVKADETQNSKKMFYIYDGDKWETTYEVSPLNMIGRDFTISPIELQNEVIGVLPEDKIDTTIVRKTDLDKKIDKIKSATENNLFTINSDGNLKDSGMSIKNLALKTNIHNHSNKNLLDSYTQSETDLKDTVLKKHEHNNKETLDKLTTNTEGRLLFNGQLIESASNNSFVLSNYYNKIETNDIIGKENLETTAQTIKGAINEVKQQSFQNGVNAKNKIVTALASRDMNVTINNTFTELAEAIIALTLPPTTLQTTKLNVNKGEKKIINYGRDLKDLQFATSVLKFKQGEEGISEKICSYNNTDQNNFIYDKDKTIFDGQMKPKNVFKAELINTKLLMNKIEYDYKINKNNYKNIEGFIADIDNINIQATMPSYIIFGKGDIDITNIEVLNNINLNIEGYKVLISFNSGDNWYSFYNNEWTKVDINNLEEVKEKAMSKNTINNLNQEQLESIRKDSNTLKFAYYQEQNSINDVIYTDELSLGIDMKGKDVIANQSDWNYRVCEDNMSIEYTFNTDGTFTINRI